MKHEGQIPSIEDGQIAQHPVPAAKLHVLNLTPIKERLGDKWPRLSELVHKLFEKALRNAQGPYDNFLLVDELSYVISFRGLSFEEANLACAAIAREACERLFGNAAEDVSVRALVSMISPEVFSTDVHSGGHIASILELTGRETVVKSSTPAGTRELETTVTPGSMDAQWVPISLIQKAKAILAHLGLSLGLFPIWDLQKYQSTCLYLSPYSESQMQKIGSVRRLLYGLKEQQIVEIEVTLLHAANAYAHRVHKEHKVCAVGVGVSYETLSGFNSRIRYIGALKSLRTVATCPLLVKIEKVPEGTPLSRIAEIIAMLSAPNVRFTVDFQSPRSISGIDIRLGAAGIGCVLPPHCDDELLDLLSRKLVALSGEQKMFVFLDGLESAEQVRVAQKNAVRFGTGIGLGTDTHSLTDTIPKFPLPQKTSLSHQSDANQDST